MKLTDAKILAHEMMGVRGLLEKGWRFGFDRSRVRFGMTNYRKLLISISRTLTQLNSVEAVKDTILHEIAHAVAGKGSGHGPAWRAVAFQIGCNGRRCYGSEVTTPERPWQAVCANCGPLNIFRFMRKKNQFHTRCNGRLVWKPREVRS